MRRTMLLLLCVSLVLGGCKALLGDPPRPDSSGSAPGGADDPIGGGGGKADPGAGGGGVALPNPIFEDASRQEPNPTVVAARPVGVDHFAIGPDGRTVVIYWWGGNDACFGMKEVKVEAGDGGLTVTVLEGARGDHVGMACTMEALLKSAVVTLDEPILADAANGDPAAGEPDLPVDALQAKRVAGVVEPIANAVSGYRLSADGRTLSAYYVGGVEECRGLANATAEPNAHGILTVSIREGQLPKPMGACREIAVAKFVELQLDEPLITAGVDS
jgi:hypothetical protein